MGTVATSNRLGIHRMRRESEIYAEAVREVEELEGYDISSLEYIEQPD